jgi:hypothetical protein
MEMMQTDLDGSHIRSFLESWIPGGTLGLFPGVRLVHTSILTDSVCSALLCYPGLVPAALCTFGSAFANAALFALVYPAVCITLKPTFAVLFWLDIFMNV